MGGGGPTIRTFQFNSPSRGKARYEIVGRVCRARPNVLGGPRCTRKGKNDLSRYQRTRSTFILKAASRPTEGRRKSWGKKKRVPRAPEKRSFARGSDNNPARKRGCSYSPRGGERPLSQRKGEPRSRSHRAQDDLLDNEKLLSTTKGRGRSPLASGGPR